MSEKEKCPDCGGEIIKEEDESYCKVCGLVIDEAPVDMGKETTVTEVSAPVTFLNPEIGTAPIDLKKENWKRKR